MRQRRRILGRGNPADILILQQDDAEAAILLKDENIGWVTPPGDPAALAQAILQAASEAAATKENGQRATQIASRYSPQIALGAYRDLMDRLLRRSATIEKKVPA